MELLSYSKIDTLTHVNMFVVSLLECDFKILCRYISSVAKRKLNFKKLFLHILIVKASVK